MTSEQKEKLIKRIGYGQSLKMLSWEFKMKEYEIMKFAKENGYVIRKDDYLRYSNQLDKKKVSQQ
jgi:hypothetical protein